MVLHGISWKEKLFYFKQIPPKFPPTSENFVGMTRFYEVRRQMRRTSTWFGYAHHRTLSDQAAFALNT